jgi:hypothetical protein
MNGIIEKKKWYLKNYFTIDKNRKPNLFSA